MRRGVYAFAVALPVVAVMGIQPALAQKSGGIFKIYHRDTPASASIHEEATNSVNMPFMNVFNNLVLFDQLEPINSLETIRPDLAESWSWNDDRTKLPLKLREGVTWNVGTPVHRADGK